MHELESVQKELTERTKNIFNEEGVELIDLELKSVNSALILRFLVDKQGGITIKECTRLSRCIGKYLEETDLIDGKYFLEVSSPGADRKLETRTDFWLSVNRRLRIVLEEPVEDRKTYVGLLKSVGDRTIVLETESGPDIVITLDNIIKAKQEVRFGSK